MDLRQGASYIISESKAFAKRRPIVAFFTVIWLLLLTGNLAKLALHLGPSMPERTTAKPATATQPVPQKTVANSGWDGSVWQVERYLERTLKDPDSFEAIEWSEVVDNGDGFAVRCKYRAKNSFGGFVIEEHVFVMNVKGEVISVAEWGKP